MPISDDDLNYLRNINTRPGPNAGKSIDPTKPGPSDKTDEWDREHDALKTRFEEWAFTRGHRNFTKSGGGYLLPEIQKDWLAFKAGATALLPDCPTDGVAARQGNGG